MNSDPCFRSIFRHHFLVYVAVISTTLFAASLPAQIRFPISDIDVFNSTEPAPLKGYVNAYLQEYFQFEVTEDSFGNAGVSVVAGVNSNFTELPRVAKAIVTLSGVPERAFEIPSFTRLEFGGGASIWFLDSTSNQPTDRILTGANPNEPFHIYAWPDNYPFPDYSLSKASVPFDALQLDRSNLTAQFEMWYIDDDCCNNFFDPGSSVYVPTRRTGEDVVISPYVIVLPEPSFAALWFSGLIVLATLRRAVQTLRCS